jgi:ABC-2 type transport system ATP-binding protein
MLQRVGIAQAILHDPQVVFLDEPMSGLDPVGRREVRDIILNLKRQGRTVFFSTHILSDAEMLCDRVGVLVGGKLQGVGAPEELVSMEVLGMEILFEVHAGSVPPTSMAERATHTGNRYRIEVAEAELYCALEELKSCHARILSVTPLRPSLEDYFFKLVGREKTPQPPAEVSVV